MSHDTNTRDNSWDGILAEGEKILWQGQPNTRISPKAGQIGESLFGLFFIGFSVVWMRTAYAASGGPIWMFGLIFFFIGAYNFFGKYLWQAYERGHTWYTLSDRTAYIATDTPLGGRRLKSHPINADTPIEFNQGPLSSIYFADQTYRVNGRSRSAQVAFENLTEGRAVYDMMLEIRKNAE